MTRPPSNPFKSEPRVGPAMSNSLNSWRFPGAARTETAECGGWGEAGSTRRQLCRQQQHLQDRHRGPDESWMELNLHCPGHCSSLESTNNLEKQETDSPNLVMKTRD